jgi:hypothetical protein
LSNERAPNDTSAPRRAISRAQAKPIPDEAPVMIITLFNISQDSSLLVFLFECSKLRKISFVGSIDTGNSFGLLLHNDGWIFSLR